ncbi:MAG: UvrB/UvrC motif-containing protein [bacterium]
MQREDLKKYELPDVPGVYLFTRGKGRSKKILYVGKASSLRDRVRSYFDDDLIATRGPKLVDMITRADGLMHEPTPTVLEALVREAALIRHYDPPANTEGKDGKSFLYAVITDEETPRVLAVRGKDIDFEKLVANGQKLREAYGPFPSGAQLREALRLIGRIFPFFDTERPVTSTGKQTRANIEFNTQIGRYPRGMDRASYLRSIRNVCLFLSGRVKTLKKTLEKDMRQAAKEERFEDAAVMRGQLYAIDHVQDVSLIKPGTEWVPGTTKAVDSGPRIEAYDTAHISGTNAIGVLVAVEGGLPIKKDYRTFKIRTARNDDIASLKEVLGRRLGHPEWPLPRAIVVDGGKTHKKAAEELLKEVGVMIPVVAVVKDEKHRPREVLGALRAGISEADAVLANSEAHRFSLNRHRRARSAAMRR